jgi:hypothetical protein
MWIAEYDPMALPETVYLVGLAGVFITIGAVIRSRLVRKVLFALTSNIWRN